MPTCEHCKKQFDWIYSKMFCMECVKIFDDYDYHDFFSCRREDRDCDDFICSNWRYGIELNKINSIKESIKYIKDFIQHMIDDVYIDTQTSDKLLNYLDNAKHYKRNI
jgi:hypothetical protein